MAFNGALAVLLAAKYCKHNPLFAWREEAFPEIGRRTDKFCFRVDLLNLLQDRCGEMLITLFPVSLSFLDFRKENMLYKLKALLVTLKHPYILPVVDIHYSKEKRGLLVLQPLVAAGSLKDRIYRTAPTRSYREKYRVVDASPLPANEIARFGRQVLEALAALRSKGIVCEHLSSGNIMIDDGNARIADIFTPLLAIDRYKETRELTVPLEAKVELDLLLFGHVLYEMATGMELASVQPEEGVLELLAPEIADVLELIFFPAYISRRGASFASSTGSAAGSQRSAFTEVEEEGNDDEDDDDDTESVTTTSSTASSAARSERQRRQYVVTLDDVLDCALFASADVAPIASLFAGFRFDSSMKSTIKASMRINASRNQAYVVHFKEKQALQRARQRAERRVYDERDKQEQRIQQLAANTNQPPRNLSFNSKTTLSRRKSYRASGAAVPHRQLSRASSSSGVGGGSSADPSSARTA